jgi:hypothetical protein
MQDQFDDVPIAGATDEEDARVRAFIAQVDSRFTFAKSVPEAPHWYLVRAWLSPGLQAEFDAFADLIEKVGYKGEFWNARWLYVDLGAFKYWTSREWHGQGDGLRGMLNRARLDGPGQMRMEGLR